MTPTKAGIDFFALEEAKRIQELWEPSQGNWVILKGKHVHKRPLLVVQTGYEGGVVYLFGTMQKARGKHTVIFLPRQGQLQEMLKERGYWWLMGVGASTQDYIVEIRDWEGVMPLIAKTSGPTPSIALGRALIEVMKGV